MPKETQSCALFLIRRSVLLTQAGLSVGRNQKVVWRVNLSEFASSSCRAWRATHRAWQYRHYHRAGKNQSACEKATMTAREWKWRPCTGEHTHVARTQMGRFLIEMQRAEQRWCRGSSRVSGVLLKISALRSLRSFVWDTSLNDSAWIFNSCLKRAASLDVAESEGEYKREKGNKGEHQELWPNVAIKAPYASIKAVHSPINTINLGNSIIPV